jgi:7-carboxy-7-deazaguanine synthase
MTALRVTEIFHSIQGESTWAGLPCVFVRLTGCPLRCRWCDTAYAFYGGTKMEESEILTQVASFGCSLVEVTGGEPLAQPECRSLLRRLAGERYTVLLETSGALPIHDVDARVRIILDLKCPDSGEEQSNSWQNLADLKPIDEVKFVVATRRDYEWAREVARDHDLPARHAVILSPVWGEMDPARLARWVLTDGVPFRVQVQLQKVLFGPDTRGV